MNTTTTATATTAAGPNATTATEEGGGEAIGLSEGQQISPEEQQLRTELRERDMPKHEFSNLE